MSQLSHELRFFALDETELKTEIDVEYEAEPLELMIPIPIPNPLEDWKLNPDIQSRIVLHKLKIKTPENGTMEFCRNFVECLRTKMMTTPSVSVPSEYQHSQSISSTTDDDIHFKSQFVLHVLLNEILGECREKCDLCDDYVHKLSHHIIQDHDHGGQPKTNTKASPSPDSDPVSLSVFKCGICGSICSSPSMLIRHWNTHSDDSDTSTVNSSKSWNLDRMIEGGVGGRGGHAPNPNPETESPFHIPMPEPESKYNEICSSVQQLHPQHSLPSNLSTSLPLTLTPQWNCVKEEEVGSEELELGMNEIEIPYPEIGIGIPQHMNDLLRMRIMGDNEVEEEEEWEEDQDQDPLLLPQLSTPDPSLPRSVVRHESVLDNKWKGLRRFKCDVCGKCFFQRGNLTQHRLIHAGEKPHGCDVCGKSFLTPANLRRHNLTHTGEKPFHCGVCGKRFSQSAHLNYHKLTHTGEKPHECGVCGKRFANTQNLTNHKMTHTGEKPFHCDVCGKNFAQSHQLNNHKMTHTGEKPHECDVCGKRFANTRNLINHKMTHTGEKPFHCDVCGKSFIQSSNLKAHKLTHTGEKRHECDVCGKRFSIRRDMRKHQVTHTHTTRQKKKPTTHVHHFLTIQNNLKEEHEHEQEHGSEDIGCPRDPLLNLDVMD